ncbi:MAG: hypothetical protein QXO93_01775 [Acidilobaceae archaeon]
MSKSINAESILDELALNLQEHVELLEEVRKIIALNRASRNYNINLLLDAMSRLRSNRAKIMTNLEFIMNIDIYPHQVDDLIALLGYYVEIAFSNERKLLLEVRKFINIDNDIEELNRTRDTASEILARTSSTTIR